MEHYVSTCIAQGEFANLMVKAPLLQVLKEAMVKAPESKADCWLISNGYSDKGGKYTRGEFNFQWLDTVLIDADNDEGNPRIIDEFIKENDRWDFFLWETASSTPEKPKFRAIVLLDRKIPWINEPVKFTKQAIQSIFSKWQDSQASWFFTPNKPKRWTMLHHVGEPYPSANIERIVDMNLKLNEALSHSTSGLADRKLRDATRKFNPDGWRHLPSVKHCLDGLEKGERDTSLNRACYAMSANGYGERIGEFLDEVVSVDEQFKRKWRNRYK